jgi:tetratricopeptide (TPR) repeat protein
MSRPRQVALVLALVTLAIYLPVANHGFSIFDDNDYVTNNSIVRRGLTWDGIKWAFTTGHAANWHPLTWISHMLDCQLFGLDARAHHIVNVVIHAANTVFLFMLLLRWIGALWPGAFAAALFALHPLHVESVAWISERKDLLSTFFALLTLLAYTRYVQERQNKCEPQIPKNIPPFASAPYSVALIFYALSLLSKPMMVTLPFVMLLLDYWPLSTGNAGVAGTARFRKLALEKWPFFALSAACCVITFLVQRSGGMVSSLENVSLGDRLENVPIACVRYLWKLFWPANLAVFYPFFKQISPLSVIAATAILIFISVMVWRARERAPYGLVGWLCFVGTLVPVVGLVSIGGLSIADRYTYFPSIGIFFAVTLGVRDLVNRFLPLRQVLALPVLLLAGILVFCTERQLHYWRDDVSLFSHAIEVNRDTRWVQYRYLGWLHLRLSIALENEGRHAEARAESGKALELEPNRAESHQQLANLLAASGEPKQALAEYQKALRLDPNSASAHYNLGVLLGNLGNDPAALEEYAAAVQLAPDSVRTHVAFASLLAKLDHVEKALTEYEMALQLDSDSATAHLGIADLLTQTAQFDEAQAHYLTAERLTPKDWHPFYQQGRALLTQGRDADAVAAFRSALKLAPNNNSILITLAQLLAANANSKIRDGHAALELAQRALALSDGAQPSVFDILAMAQAELGNFDDAQKSAQRALELVEARHLTSHIPALQERLELYRNHQPYRLPTNAAK